jgi:hypothetical protein
MRKLVTGTLFATAAAAAAIGLTASSASALTFTVSGSSATGDLTAISEGSTTLVVHHSSGNVTLTCSSSDGTGNVPNGTGNGQPLGHINSLNFNNCLLGGIIPFTVTTTNFPWNLNGDSFANDVTTGTITKVHANVAGTNCSLKVDGTGPDTNDGSVGATYDNGTAVLGVTPGTGNLHVWDVVGCNSLVSSGDPANFSGDFDVDPPITVTAS